MKPDDVEYDLVSRITSRFEDEKKARSYFLDAMMEAHKARQHRKRPGQRIWWASHPASHGTMDGSAQDDPNPKVHGKFCKFKSGMAQKSWVGVLGSAAKYTGKGAKATGKGLKTVWDFPTPAVLRGPLYGPLNGPVWIPPWKRRRSDHRGIAGSSGNERVASSQPARTSHASASDPRMAHHRNVAAENRDRIEPAPRATAPDPREANHESVAADNKDHLEPAFRSIGEPVSHFSSSSTKTGGDATRNDSAAANFFRRASATLGISKLIHPNRPNPRGYGRL